MFSGDSGPRGRVGERERERDMARLSCHSK